MKAHIITTRELATLKTSLDRLYDLRLLLPGAIDRAAGGNEHRRALLLEMLDGIEKPDDLNAAILEELNTLNRTLTQIETDQLI